MLPEPMRVVSSAPGRICLFGEHQDYMGFPVIAAAIDLRITIEGSVTPGTGITLGLPDLAETVAFSQKKIRYTRQRDYFKSTVQVLKTRNLVGEQRIEARVRGNIPIQAGTSSSSAMVVAWAGFLLYSSRPSPFPGPEEIAEIAYLAEVEEFGESGGRMDQYTSALGGIVHIDFGKATRITSLPVKMKEFVLGDSLHPKDTQKTLRRIRGGQQAGLQELKKHLPSPTGPLPGHDEAAPYFNRISAGLRPYVRGVLKNRQITSMARDELLREKTSQNKLARLVNDHHAVLRDELNLSTPKIEKMIENALKAGARAAKINGSGEGGCMFAYCPGKQRVVAEAIRRVGGKPYIIHVGRGLEVKVSK